MQDNAWWKDILLGGNPAAIQLLLQSYSLNLESINKSLLELEHGNFLEKAKIKNLLLLYAFIYANKFDHRDMQERNQDGDTPLVLLCKQCNKIDKVELLCAELLNLGAHINTKDREDNSGLYYACINNHIGMVRLLLESGASPAETLKKLIKLVPNNPHIGLLKLYDFNINQRLSDLNFNTYNQEGYTALSLALLSNQEEGLLQDLLKLYQNNSNKLTIKEILEHPNADGTTLLHLAIKFQKIKTIEFLLKQDVAIYLQDLLGNAPFDLIDLSSVQISDLFKNYLNELIANLSEYSSVEKFLIAAYEQQNFNKIYAIGKLRPSILNTSQEFLLYVLCHGAKVPDLLLLAKMGFNLEAIIVNKDLEKLPLVTQALIENLIFLQVHKFHLSTLNSNNYDRSVYFNLIKIFKENKLELSNDYKQILKQSLELTPDIAQAELTLEAILRVIDQLNDDVALVKFLEHLTRSTNFNLGAITFSGKTIAQKLFEVVARLNNREILAMFLLQPTILEPLKAEPSTILAIPNPVNQIDTNSYNRTTLFSTNKPKSNKMLKFSRLPGKSS